MEEHDVLEGTAEELTTLLTPYIGTTPFDNLSGRKLARKLSSLWPHLASKYDAEKTTVHGGALHYRIKKRRPEEAGRSGDSGDSK